MAARIVVLLALCGWLGKAGASPIVVDTNGRMVGFYLGVGYAGWRDKAVTPEGYRITFARGSGFLAFDVNELVGFATPDCTGSLRAQPVAPGFVRPLYTSGTGDVPSEELVYVPQNAQVADIPILSIPGADGQCFSPSNPITSSLEAFPNDPEITGISSSRLPAPLRIISSWVFRNGFEQPLSSTSPTGDESSQTT